MPFNVPLADPALAGIKKAQQAALSHVPLANGASTNGSLAPHLATGPLANPNLTTVSNVVSAIRDASMSSGMPFNVMLASAQMESGLNPSAQASTSSAKGLFQFIDQTWLDAVRQFGPRHGLAAEAASIVRRDGKFTVDDPAARIRILELRKDPAIASALAGDHLRAISERLGVTLGRPPDATEIYLGHLLGSNGAAQLLQAARSSPNQSASALLPAAASANPTLFASPGGTPYTIDQFMRHLHDRVGRAYASIGAAMPSGPIPLAGTTAGGAYGSAKNLQLVGAGLHRAPEGADPAEAGATGWGINRSRHSRPAFERQLMATMSQVFSRLDRDNHGARKTLNHGKGIQGLPSGLLDALKPGGGGVSV